VERGGYFQRFRVFQQLQQLLSRTNLRITDAFYLNLLAVATGALVGLFVYLFKGAVNWVSEMIRGDSNILGIFATFDNALRGDSAGGQLGAFDSLPWLVYLMPPLGGLIVGLTFRFWGRHRQFRGVSAVIESVARRGGKLNLRKGALELLNSGISIASGLSVGMEGPIVVAGSTIGSNISQGFRLSPARTRVLLASGAAAGVSAVFNAPIAGFFFALELILGDFRKKAVAAIVLASVSANVTTKALTGGEAVFDLPAYTLAHHTEIINYLLLGLLCGLVAFLFAQLLLYFDIWVPRWKIWPPFKPMFGGLAVAGLAFFFPEILGTGHHTVERLINGHFPHTVHLLPGLEWGWMPAYLVVLCFAKLIATSMTLGSGAAGGKFAPSLFMGASLGGVFGFIVSNQSFNGATDPAAYALVGMATIFGSIAQAPLTVILLVFEMTGNYTMILPMMTAGVVSQVVFYSLRKEGVFTHKLAKLGVKFGRGKDLSILEAIPVTDAMHSGVETILCTEKLCDIRKRFADTDHHGFPVVDETGKLCGIVTTSDLVECPKDEDAPLYASDICTSKVFMLREGDDCHQAIAILEDYHVGRVPVVDVGEKPIGIITRTDIIGAYKLALQLREREMIEEG